MAHLIITRDGRPEGRADIKSAVVRVGRDPANEIQLSDPTKWVSRFHAEIRAEGATYTIVDLNSPNGLTVNGQRTRQTVLAPGTRVGIGPYTLEFVAGAATAEAVPDFGTVSAPRPDGPARARTQVPESQGRTIPARPRASRFQRQALTFVACAAAAGMLGVVAYNRTPTPEPPVTVAAAKDPDKTLITRLLAEATDAFGRGDLDTARSRANEVLRLESGNPEALLLLQDVERRISVPAPSDPPPNTSPSPPIRPRGAGRAAAGTVPVDAFNRVENLLSIGQADQALRELDDIDRQWPNQPQVPELRGRASGQIFEDARTRMSGTSSWESVEAIAGEAQQRYPGSLAQRILDEKDRLLDRNRAAAKLALSEANQQHASSNVKAAIPLYERVMRLIPKSDDNYRAAEDGLRKARGGREW